MSGDDEGSCAGDLTAMACPLPVARSPPCEHAAWRERGRITLAKQA
jgi:hypothetical protein